MKSILFRTAVGAAALALIGAGPAPQKQTGPVAVYWISASTASGPMAAMAGGAPTQRPSFGQMMSGGFNPGGVMRTLRLQLGSSRKIAAPAADHVMPPSMRLGASVPLLPPEQAAAPRGQGSPEDYRREKPKGRILIYWGCGAKAGPGQPFVLDFAKMAAGQQDFAALSAGQIVSTERGPSAETYASYAEWPNRRSSPAIPAGASLAGDHAVRGNFAPEIKLALTPGTDFMAPIRLSQTPAAGAMRLTWPAIGKARGIFLYSMGAQEGRGGDSTMVLWTSSKARSWAMAAPDYLSDGDLARLVASGALLPGTATECVVPQEVVSASGQGMLMMTAFGQEANFAHPARPADPKVAWNIEWTTKIRYRSTYGGLLGMNGEDFGDASEAQPEEGKPPPKESKGRKILRGLGIPGT